MTDHAAGFETLDHEVSVDRLPVQGELPPWLSGSLIRTGPARFEGLEPNGARMEIEGLDLLTIRDGLIRENRAYTNATEIARQLGAMPPAGSVGEKAMLGAVNVKTRAQSLLKRA